jgi:hypothetical protein
MQRLRALTRGGLAAIVRSFDLRDAFVFGGLGCAVYGVAQYSHAAAWIVAGVVLFWLGVRR